MNNFFRAGKMASNILDSLLVNGKSDASVIDGAIVVLGDLEQDSDYPGDCEYDTYEMHAPLAPTDDVAIVDYAGIGEGAIAGGSYKLGDKLVGLEVPAGVPTRVRRIRLHDKFWLGEGNFESSPTIGGYAVVEKGSYLHKSTDSLPKNGYAIKIISAEDMAVGMSSFGKKYLCEVVHLGWKDGKDLLNATPTEQAAYLIKELKGRQSLSNYLQANSDSIMEAAGIKKGEDGKSVLDTLYDKLQAGDEIKATMSDGAVLSLTGHFSDETGRWKLQTEISLPAKASGAMFPDDSEYTLKDGTVKVTMDPAEMTKMDPYGGCIIVYGYSLDVSGVKVSNGAKEYEVDISGLAREEDPNSFDDYGLIIDPNKEKWAVTVHEFKLPDDDAAGTIKIDGKPVAWRDVKNLVA